MSQQYQRRSIRLQEYNYAQGGAYFVTICTQLRELFFDKPEIKQIAEQCWEQIPAHFPIVELDEWVMMPNHLHGILVLTTEPGQSLQPSKRSLSLTPPQKNTLSVIIRTYKAAVTTLCRRSGEIEFTWQRNYYEHIIRNEADLNRIRQYIFENPLTWDTDRENPKRK